VNLQQNPYNTYHHTFSMLPHYLVKFDRSVVVSAVLPLAGFRDVGRNQRLVRKWTGVDLEDPVVMS